MTINDDAQHYSPSILNALLCEERDTFEKDLNVDDNDYEINNKDPYRESI